MKVEQKYWLNEASNAKRLTLKQPGCVSVCERC